MGVCLSLVEFDYLSLDFARSPIFLFAKEHLSALESFVSKLGCFSELADFLDIVPERIWTFPRSESLSPIDS